MQAVIGRAVGRTFGFVSGLFLVILGFVMLNFGMELGQGGRPLVWVLIALGIGVTAASLLPNTLTLSGEKVKPLGLNLNATGGAAFFIVTLVFLFYSLDKVASAETPPADPPFTETASNPPSLPAPMPTAAPEAPSDPKEAAVVPASLPAPAPSLPDFAPVQQTAPVQQAMFEVGTYCSACCPQGPENCAQFGYGQAATLPEAFVTAVAMCVGNGGREDTCIANAEQY